MLVDILVFVNFTPQSLLKNVNLSVRKANYALYCITSELLYLTC